MSSLRRIVMVRHGETEGQSSIRFHGSTDVGLDPTGREQMRKVAGRLGAEQFGVIVASPLRRAWQSAWIAARGQPIRLDPDFREVHFGRWEGLTKEEIERADPILYQDWQNGAESFEYPSGESRASFRERVGRGLARLMADGVRSALVVTHRGVIRSIAHKLTGEDLGDAPELGGLVTLTRDGDGSWFQGRRGSNPDGVE